MNESRYSAYNTLMLRVIFQADRAAKRKKVVELTYIPMYDTYESLNTHLAALVPRF